VKKGDSIWGVKREKVILVMYNIHNAASFKLNIATIKGNFLARFDKITFTFSGPCIVIHILEKNKKMHTFSP